MAEHLDTQDPMDQEGLVLRARVERALIVPDEIQTFVMLGVCALESGDVNVICMAEHEDNTVIFERTVGELFQIPTILGPDVEPITIIEEGVISVEERDVLLAEYNERNDIGALLESEEIDYADNN